MKTEKIDFEKELQEELERLSSWSSSLAREAATMIPQIRDAVNAEKMTLPSCPSRGSLAAMCLGQVGKKFREVEGAISRLDGLLLNADAPWNNRGDEKEW
jgi:hypothetical protein